MHEPMRKMAIVKIELVLALGLPTLVQIRISDRNELMHKPLKKE